MRIAGNHRPVILETAARLFGQKPFHEVLMEDVAAHAGIAKGTIYRFYRTKEELYADICLHLLDHLNAELAKTAQEKAPARQRLEKMVQFVVRHFRQHRDSFQVVQREWSGACMGSRAAFLARRGGAVKVFTRVLRGGQAAGEFRSVAAKPAAEMLLGMIRNMVRFGDPRLAPAQVSRVILNIFLHGIDKHKGSDQA
jgi:TetR/AcrR family fatty acid metabolism transcriptional regulator